MSNDIRKQMWLAMAESPYVMVSLNKNADHSEPMRAQLDKDADNCFWFYTKRDNRIADGGKTTVTFTSKDHDVFACIIGDLSEETDQDVVDKYWSNQVEAWYEGGKSDPKLKMMRFDLKNAEVWQVDTSITGMLKLATGAKVDSDEMGEHQKISF
ncbi:pyridoxamine 5'-phosphate oxidase family protein [Alteromonas oceanisediminis]|uniref:pyridoxamine 5'-phosphate oxidase family protein n=1 Tax=Alteromonas oceanisediminis TaxID=2836180 RepID=UPI001BDABD22|nr:pyridoxamine 5'-phosphate oxidase family protein [Alteromonas oceanisediminis]MBT0586608.1 pyridoxamine 5'-phosphate oxidase family protein [Alteromonas oceanisediminis]